MALLIVRDNQRSPTNISKHRLDLIVTDPRLLAPWSRFLLEKLTGFQPVKKFPAFYGTQKLITEFTSARHLSLS